MTPSVSLILMTLRKSRVTGHQSMKRQISHPFTGKWSTSHEYKLDLALSPSIIGRERTSRALVDASRRGSHERSARASCAALAAFTAQSAARRRVARPSGAVTVASSRQCHGGRLAPGWSRVCVLCVRPEWAESERNGPYRSARRIGAGPGGIAGSVAADPSDQVARCDRARTWRARTAAREGETGRERDGGTDH